MRAILFLGVAGVLVWIGLWAARVSVPQSGRTGSERASVGGESRRAGQEKEPESPSPEMAQPRSKSDTANAGDPDFQMWISTEARDLDRIKVDGAEKQREIRDRVARLTEAEAGQLMRTVRDPKAPAREKILSAYLLIEGGARTQAALTELIMAPLEEPRDFEPHSDAEMKGVREKSLRIMAIDGLFSQARSDAGAKSALARAARESDDPSVRAYAEDKLRQLR